MRTRNVGAALALLVLSLVSVGLALFDANSQTPAMSIEWMVTGSFWQSPVLLVGAFAPFILLGVTLAAGWWLKRREQRLDTGPVRPPGWDRDQ